jgi:membrane protease YdiL (CAAX protease family)
MTPPWPDATFSPLGAGIGVLLVGWFLLVEPPRGRWALARLRERRVVDAGALLAFYRLTTVSLSTAAAVALAVVLLEPGVDAADVGLAWPALPDSLPGPLGGLVVGGSIGFAVVLLAGVVAGRRGRAVGPAPPYVALLFPRTRRERRGAVIVSVTAGTGEEFVFRGLFLALGVGVFGLSPLVSAALGAVVFGLAHIYQGLPGVFGTALLGAGFAALTLVTQSLLLPVLLHTLVDLRALLLTPPPASVGTGQT